MKIFRIKDGRCAGGEIRIVTVFLWNNATIGRNMAHMDYELQRLQKYSGISTSEFCPTISKTPAEHNGRFAVIYQFKYLMSTCDRVRLFVKNAVSWSSEVSSARVNCECEQAVEMTRA
uniref:Uncharacterized protein n=1 Tax=Caenorhabditis japonica TaxID=281687 RepID=A0A8R1HKE5_CAEJA